MTKKRKIDGIRYTRTYTTVNSNLKYAKEDLKEHAREMNMNLVKVITIHRSVEGIMGVYKGYFIRKN